MMIFNLCIGTITPPVGTTLFVGVKVGQTKIEQVIKPLLAYFCSDLCGADAGILRSRAVYVAAGPAGIRINKSPSDLSKLRLAVYAAGRFCTYLPIEDGGGFCYSTREKHKKTQGE